MEKLVLLMEQLDQDLRSHHTCVQGFKSKAKKVQFGILLKPLRQTTKDSRQAVDKESRTR